MTTQTANYLNAIAHLPAGGTLILGTFPGRSMSSFWPTSAKAMQSG